MRAIYEFTHAYRSLLRKNIIYRHHLHMKDSNCEQMTAENSAVFTIDLNKTQRPVHIEPSHESEAHAEKSHCIHVTRKCAQEITNYLVRFKGLHKERPKRLTWDEYLWAAIGSFISTAVMAFFHYKLLRP